jgi:aminoglycoside phosphotransferase (APT) family kinase protein
MAATGPVVIDWTNAAAGSPDYDVADTWVLLAAADVPAGGAARLVAILGRRLFLHSFLRHLDRGEIRSAIPAVVEFRLSDRNMSEAERSRMRALVHPRNG